MSIVLRAILFIVSICTAIFVGKRLKRSQMKVFAAIFWIMVVLLLIFMSLFPSVVIKLAKLVGIITPVNFIFLLMIFLLLINAFMLSVKVSVLDETVRNLVQELAIKEHFREEEEENE